MSPLAPDQKREAVTPRAILGDRILLAAVMLSALAAAAMGFLYDEPLLGLVAGLLLAGLSAGVYLMARGTAFSRMALTTLQVALVLGMGRTAREGEALAFMGQWVNQTDGIERDVSGVWLSTPVVLALQGALQRMQAVVASVPQSSAQIEMACREIDHGNQELSQRMEAAASSLREQAQHLVHAVQVFKAVRA